MGRKRQQTAECGIKRSRAHRAARFLGISVSAWISAVFFMWVCWFSLRVYINYKDLEDDYDRAIKLTDYATRAGHEYIELHREDFDKARTLLAHGQVFRAFQETWSATHLCGALPCYVMIFGDMSTLRLSIYMIMIALTSSVISQMSGILQLAAGFVSPFFDAIAAKLDYARTIESDAESGSEAEPSNDSVQPTDTPLKQPHQTAHTLATSVTKRTIAQ